MTDNVRLTAEVERLTRELAVTKQALADTLQWHGKVQLALAKALRLTNWSDIADVEQVLASRVVDDGQLPKRVTGLLKQAATVLTPKFRTGDRVTSDAMYPIEGEAACPEPDCTEPRSEPGGCPVHEIPLLHIGPDGHEAEA